MYTLNKSIFLVGMPASGKSKLGKAIAKYFSVPFVDLDSYIVYTQNETIDIIFEVRGETKFREIESRCLEDYITSNKDNIYICASGGGTPCFNDNINMMKEAGEIIYLKLSEERIHKRLVSSSNMHRPQWKKRSSDDVKSMVETLVLRRKPFYEQASKILTLVDNYKIDCENLIRLIVND